ncbi:MAG: Na/Pi cotransporter family protein [Acidisphaera sp.]|nr:Na/Pi cotransporter family protein [Acidisphaera sp.]
MDATLTLVNLAGCVALLLWGVHMVQSGIQRAFGPNLRRLLGAALGSRARAFFAGLGVTAVLQSSTATGLMVASFAAGGLVDLVPALAAMLGANVGTTLIVQVLSFDVSDMAMLLVLVGVVTFRRAGATRTRDLGRVAIGLGLMLLALHQLLALITPYADVPSLRLLLGAIATQPLLDLLLAAALTWAAHSSVAVMLLVMSFCAKGVVPPQAAFALVLGANLGTAINPVLEGASGEDPASRRVPLGNLIARMVGAVCVLSILPWLAPMLVQVDPGLARVVADFHTAFNVAVAAVLFPVLPLYARALRRFLPGRVTAADPGLPVYLSDAAHESPPIALAAAAREALRMADVLESMLGAAQDALIKGDRRRIGEARRMDDVLDRLNLAIKAYLSSMDTDSLSEADHQRLTEIFTFTTNLEHAGDVLDKNLMAQANKRLKRGFAFSPEGAADIESLLQRLRVNLRAAAAVFMTGDARAARSLVAEKAAFRDREASASQAHFARLRAGRVDSSETSALHLDVLRDLKRLNTHLVAAAYAVLEAQGDLLPSRLRPTDSGFGHQDH